MGVVMMVGLGYREWKQWQTSETHYILWQCCQYSDWDNVSAVSQAKCQRSKVVKQNYGCLSKKDLAVEILVCRVENTWSCTEDELYVYFDAISQLSHCIAIRTEIRHSEIKCCSLGPKVYQI